MVVCGFRVTQRVFLVDSGMLVRSGSVEGVLCKRATGLL
jgi:hypothetical protein